MIVPVIRAVALIKASEKESQVANWGHHCPAQSNVLPFDIAHSIAGFMAGAADL